MPGPYNANQARGLCERPRRWLVSDRLRGALRDRVARSNAPGVAHLIVLLSLEIMLNGANLALIAFARQHGSLDGQIFALAVMAVAAAEVAEWPRAHRGHGKATWPSTSTRQARSEDSGGSADKPQWGQASA